MRGWVIFRRLWRLEVDPGYWENAISSDDNPKEIAFSLAWGFLKPAGTPRLKITHPRTRGSAACSTAIKHSVELNLCSLAYRVEH